MRQRIDKLTRGGTYAFTPRQLESLWFRRQRSSGVVSGPFLVCTAMATFVMFIACASGVVNPCVAACVYFLGLGAIVMIRRRFPPAAEAEPLVREWLRQWVRSEREPGLILEPSLGVKPSEVDDPQFDHGVERVLIVDRDDLVDFFVRSGFHAEHRCLVVSMTGYPTYLKSRAQRVIADTDRPVFLLHGTIISGAKMVEDGVFDVPAGRATDLGLSWAMVARHAGLRRFAESGAREIAVDHLLPMELIGAVALCMDRNAPLVAVTDTASRPEDDYGMFLLVDAFG
ncbi:MAG: hypothetical protein P8R54_02620 [Myxococcota bacterium]|nr:hypothetical protein [Myxococcota bacterium]